MVKLSFFINSGRDYCVLLKCLLAELTAKIIKPHQSLLPPLTPAWKLIFDSLQSYAVVSICSVVWRLPLLPSLLRVLKVSPGSFFSFPLISFLSRRVLLRICELISGVHDTTLNIISFLSSKKAKSFLFFVLKKYRFIVQS